MRSQSATVKRGKGRAVCGTLYGDRVRKRPWFRRPLEIGADMRQPFAFDHRTDIIEDDGLECRRANRREHVDDETAARGSDENAMLDAERRQPGDDIAGLDRHAIVFPVWIVGRLAAATVVERNNPARPCRIA